MMARVPGIAVADKLNSPVLKHVSEVNGNIRLLIEVNDTLATQIRIFRGVKGGMLALPKLIQINGAAVISYTDSTLTQGNAENVFYAVRNEKDGSAISSLSEQLTVSAVTDVNEVAYFDAFLSKGKIELYWDDVAGRNTNFAGYTLARQNGQANSKSPLRIIAENLKASSFTDNDATAGNQYTYVLTLIDKAGNSTGKSYKVTIPKDL